MTHGVGARAEPGRGGLVGRGAELASFERLLDALLRGPAAALELSGEPGIGKTRLLSELATLAERRGYLVLSGSASELEHELPFSVFVDALDEHIGSIGADRLSGLDADVQAELAEVLPSLAALPARRPVAVQHERYRSHRAVRSLLERLAAGGPVVLVLDDFHWADSASVELLGALLRRPPAAAVLVAIALRPRQTPERLASTLERAQRAAALSRVELGALTLDDARALLGDSLGAPGAAAVYRECGGNPFYLEQLARSLHRLGGTTRAPELLLTGIDVPAAVAASLGEELSLLSTAHRLVLAGAAVAGDPFEPELAAAAADSSETDAIEALDELLRLDLVRPTGVPRRFRFRHPLVRRAVYEATAAGWRLGAHERCAAALAGRGATAAARAHHVERSARQGDRAAVAVLREAGEAAERLAPESAARWFGAALRLLPGTTPEQFRVDLLLARAGALSAAGRFRQSHETLLDAVATVPSEPRSLGVCVATTCAAVERQLGRYEQAHERLEGALRKHASAESAESVELLIELTLNEFYRSRYEAMAGWAERAVNVARAVREPALLAMALAMPALAHALAGPTKAALSYRAKAAALVDELTDDDLSRRPDGASWLAVAEVYLDLYVDADEHAARAHGLARAAGRGDPLFRLYPVLPRIWYVRGKLVEAAELLDGAIEAGRLLGSPPALAGNLFNRSAVALAVGDLDLALATGEEGVELTHRLDDGFVRAWAAVRLAAVLLETGRPDRAVELLLDSAGGDAVTHIPGNWRIYSLELLTRSWLALDRSSEAERAADRASTAAANVQLPLATAWAARAAAAVALHAGNCSRAVERAVASADLAEAVGAPIEAALSRTLAGRALAGLGQSERAVAELRRAAAALELCGALRYRDGAERELGKLGRRPHRRTRRGTTAGSSIGSLTERELQVAQLVVDRRTNPEIAAELFLSQKTVETHLRNIFRKVGVSTRVELARAVVRDGQGAALQ